MMTMRWRTSFICPGFR